MRLRLRQRQQGKGPEVGECSAFGQSGQNAEREGRRGGGERLTWREGWEPAMLSFSVHSQVQAQPCP